jgi:hypothetical protein
MKDKIIEILNSYVDSKLGDSEDNISAYAVDSIADEIVNLLPKHLVIKIDNATKYAELREKCEAVVYNDPDGEFDHTDLIAEIVCEEFEIM